MSGDPIALRVAPLAAAESGAVLAMVQRCSAATLYRRFHGVTKDPSRATRLLLGPEHPDQENFAAWCGNRCVGVASLSVGADGSAHTGVLVEDAFQRRRIGSALIRALVDRARERHLRTLVADVQMENSFLVQRMRRIGPTTSSFEAGGFFVSVDLAQDEAA